MKGQKPSVSAVGVRTFFVSYKMRTAAVRFSAKSTAKKCRPCPFRSERHRDGKIFLR
nr:MAG TPA: hypothetical protein [Caudoviricetes sp.]